MFVGWRKPTILEQKVKIINFATQVDISLVHLCGAIIIMRSSHATGQIHSALLVNQPK